MQQIGHLAGTCGAKQNHLHLIGIKPQTQTDHS